MNITASPFAHVLSRSSSFHLHQVKPLAGRCAGTLIHCSFDAHTVEFPAQDDVVLLAANQYRLKRALFDFGWGFRDHFSSHPHPLHVFPAHTAYRWSKDGSADVTLLTLSGTHLSALLEELGHPNASEGLWELSQRAFANPLIYEAMNQLRHQAADGASQMLVDSYCTVIAHALATQWNTRSLPGAAVRKLPAPVLARLMEFIQEHLHLDMSLDDLAAVSGMTKYHFMRCFKASTQRSPLQYVTELRVMNARQLLESTTLPLEAIAKSSGFSTADHLSRVFRNATGCSPRSYRATLGGRVPAKATSPTHQAH